MKIVTSLTLTLHKFPQKPAKEKKPSQTLQKAAFGVTVYVF